MRGFEAICDNNGKCDNNERSDNNGKCAHQSIWASKEAPYSQIVPPTDYIVHINHPPSTIHHPPPTTHHPSRPSHPSRPTPPTRIPYRLPTPPTSSPTCASAFSSSSLRSPPLPRCLSTPAALCTRHHSCFLLCAAAAASGRGGVNGPVVSGRWQMLNDAIPMKDSCFVRICLAVSLLHTDSHIIKYKQQLPRFTKYRKNVESEPG